MLDHGTDARLTAWLVLTGLFVTIPAILLLPSGAETGDGIESPHEGMSTQETPTTETAVSTREG